MSEPYPISGPQATADRDNAENSLSHTFAPIAIALLRGEDYRVGFSNKCFNDVFSLQHDIAGLPFLPLLTPSLSERLGVLLDTVMTSGKNYTTHELELVVQRSGEPTTGYFKLIVEPVREHNGILTGIMIIGTEVTEQVLLSAVLKKNEQHFRQLADLMPAKISNANSSGDVIYFNKEWLEFAGMCFEDLRDFGYHKMMHPDEIEQFTTGLQNAAIKGIAYESEMRFKNTAGEYIWHNNIAAPIKDEYGNGIMWVGVTTEIQHHKARRELLEQAVAERTTELSEANSKLEERNMSLLQLNKELESFAYISSHDLQEPLRKIQTFAQMIAESEGEQLSEKGKRSFTRIKDSAARMQLLIEDLLVYSQSGTNKTEISRSDFRAICNEVLEDLTENVIASGAVITVHGTYEVRVQRSQLRQLLHNLIGNSLKFSLPDMTNVITITVATTTSSPLGIGRNCCHISVVDQGIGFEPVYKDKIFEVFQRLHDREAYRGTGIGLAIVKKIVDHHAGIVVASAEPGKGARFDLYFPD